MFYHLFYPCKSQKGFGKKEHLFSFDGFAGVKKKVGENSKKKMAVVPSGRKTASGQTIWMAAPSTPYVSRTTGGGGTTATTPTTTATSNAYYGTDTGQKVDVTQKTSALATDRYAKNPSTGGIVDRYMQQSVAAVPPSAPTPSFRFGGGQSGGTGTTGGFREVQAPTPSQLTATNLSPQPSPTQVAPIIYPVKTDIQSWSEQRMKEAQVTPVPRTAPGQVPSQTPQGASVTKPVSFFMKATKEESLAAFPSSTLTFMGEELAKEQAGFETKWRPYIKEEYTYTSSLPPGERLLQYGEQPKSYYSKGVTKDVSRTFVDLSSTGFEEKWKGYISGGVFVGLPSDVGFQQKWGGYTQGQYFTGSTEQFQEYSKEYEEIYGNINKQFQQYTKELGQSRGVYEKQYGKFSEEQALLGSSIEWQNLLSENVYQAKKAEYERLTAKPVIKYTQITPATKDTGWWGQQEAAVAKYTTQTPIAQLFFNTKDLEYRYARLAAEERRTSFKQDSIMKSLMLTELSLSKREAEFEYNVLKGIEQKPLTFGTMFVVTAGAGLAEAGITTAVPKAIPYVKAATYGLLGLYGISVAGRISSQPTAAGKTAEFGSILGTEMLPMTLAGVAVKQIKARLIPEPEVTLLGAEGQREITRSGEVLDIIYQKGKVTTAKGEPLFDVNLEVTERYQPYKEGMIDVETVGGKKVIKIIPTSEGKVFGYRTWGAMEGTLTPIMEGAKPQPQSFLTKTAGWTDMLGKSGFTKRGVSITEFRAEEPRFEVGKGLGDVVVVQRPAPISYEEMPSWIQVGTEFKFDTDFLERISVVRTTKIASALVSNVGEAPRTIEYYQSRGMFFEKEMSADLLRLGEKGRPPVLVEEISLEEAGKLWSKHQPYGNLALRDLRGAFFDFGEVIEQSFTQPQAGISGGGRQPAITGREAFDTFSSSLKQSYELQNQVPEFQTTGEVFGTQLKDFAAQAQRNQYLSLTKSYTLIRPITATSLSSITKITPITKVTPITKLAVMPVTKVTPRISEVLKTESVTKVTPRISEVLKIEPVIKTTQKMEEVLKTEQLLKTEPVTKLSLKVPSPMPFPPIEPPPLWLGLPSLELPRGKGGRGGFLSEKKGYRPSIYATGLGITASKIPKLATTGLGIRPVITARKSIITTKKRKKEVLRMTGWLKKAKRKSRKLRL